MRRAVYFGVLVLLATFALTAGGCARNQEMSALQRQNEELLAKNQDLQSRLAQTQAGEAQLMADLARKDEQISERDRTISALRSQLANRPEQPAAGGSDWERGLVGDRVTVGGDVLFASGKADITARGKRALAPIVNALKTDYSGLPVLVYGYTDSDKITKSKWKDNLELSAARAASVTRYLISRGIDADRLDTVAKGATNFVASNATPAGKAKNRRVEIIVLRR